MTTLEQRELAGVSPTIKSALPTESKHDSDEAHKKDHELALDQKAIRELDNPIVEYNYHKELTDALWNPYEKVKAQLKEWNYRTISEDEALHTPYRRTA